MLAIFHVSIKRLTGDHYEQVQVFFYSVSQTSVSHDRSKFEPYFLLALLSRTKFQRDVSRCLSGIFTDVRAPHYLH